jgi:hypothetical protein
MLAARRRRLAALGALAAMAAAIPAAIGVAGAAPAAGPSVVVRDRDGTTIARVALPADGRFALAYRHSYYRAAAEERFVAAGGRFRLRAIASPRAAVLDYYALEGRRGRDGRWLTLRPRHAPARRRLALIATAVGRRTLVVGSRRLALHGARPRHLTIAVEDR